jgi:hypothetical protein
MGEILAGADAKKSKIKARFDLEVIDRIISDKSGAAASSQCKRTAETLNP